MRYDMRIIPDEGSVKYFFSSIYLSPSERPIGTGKTFAVEKAVRITKDGKKKDCFLKYAWKTERVGVKLLKREGGFLMTYPYLAKVYDAFWGILKEEDESGISMERAVYCVCSEYVDGKLLSDYEGKPLREQPEIEKFRQMMQLLFAQRYYMKLKPKKPYVHRDLKPDNIMIIKLGHRIVIFDFDWSHVSGSCSRENKEKGEGLGGSSGYADPRAFTAEYPIDVKQDFYSLGRVFCFMLSGRDYFQTEEEKETYYKRGYEELAYGLELERLGAEKYSQEKYAPLLRIIRKMVAPYETRYEDISDIIRDMKAFLKEYYKADEVNFFDLFGDDILLREPEDREKDEYLQSGNYSKVTYHMNDERVQKILYPYGGYDIKDVNGRCIMTIYRLGEEIYYIPYAEGLRKVGEDGAYRVMDQDIFQWNSGSLTVRRKDGFSMKKEEEYHG